MRQIHVLVCLAVCTVVTFAADDPEQYVKLLKDPATASEAIAYFESRIAARGLALPKGIDPRDIETYVKQDDENSHFAALLLGRVGDTESMPVLKHRLEAEKRYLNKLTNSGLSTLCYDACLSALVRLGDRSASDQVESMLVQDNVAMRERGILCIAYARRADLIPHLLPLLDDTRDAPRNIAGSAGPPMYLRVCDLAVYAVDAVAKLEVSFKVERGLRYSKEQISEMARAVRGYRNDQKETTSVGGTGSASQKAAQ